MGEVVSVLARALRWRAEQCAMLGSPLYGHLLAAAGEDLEAGGPTGQVLAEVVPDEADLAWIQDTGLPLRLAGSVHRLVLSGRAPGLAVHYPSADGPPPDQVDHEAAWEAFRQVLVDQPEAVAEGLTRPPQTNEVGRAAVLIGALVHLGALVGLPVRLWELGCSAGLNLRADHFRLELGGARGVGPADSPVVLERPWRGAPTGWPPLGSPPGIVERRGCDPDPIDPTISQGELSLRAYVWPDQPQRHRNLSGALRLAREIPAEVRPVGAGRFCRDLAPEAGALTLVWHSIVRKYVDDEEWEAVRSHLSRAAAAATSEAPLAHLAFEPRRQPDGSRPFLVSLQLWPDGGPGWLASAHPHGTWVRWSGEPDAAVGGPASLGGEGPDRWAAGPCP